MTIDGWVGPTSFYRRSRRRGDGSSAE